MRRFKVGDKVVRIDERENNMDVGDDYTAQIGDIAVIVELSTRYADSYHVAYPRRGESIGIWEDQYCRALTPLEKLL